MELLVGMVLPSLGTGDLTGDLRPLILSVGDTPVDTHTHVKFPGLSVDAHTQLQNRPGFQVDDQGHLSAVGEEGLAFLPPRSGKRGGQLPFSTSIAHQASPSQGGVTPPPRTWGQGRNTGMGPTPPSLPRPLSSDPLSFTIPLSVFHPSINLPSLPFFPSLNPFSPSDSAFLCPVAKAGTHQLV